MIYAIFESISVLKDNGKQNQGEFYMNKYQKHIAWSYAYKLVFVDDKFNKPFKWYLDKDAVYNFINSMIEESKYCSDLIKKILTKNLWWLKKTMKILKTTKNWMCDNDYVDNDVEIRDYCHVELNNKVLVVFHNLKHDCYLIMQELGKFNLKINVMPNRFKKYVSFTINNKLSFIGSFIK